MVKLAAVPTSTHTTTRQSWAALLQYMTGRRAAVLTGDGQVVHGRLSDIGHDLLTLDAALGRMHLPLHAVAGLQTTERFAAAPATLRTPPPSVPHEIEALVGCRVLCVSGSHRLSGVLLEVGLDCIAVAGTGMDVRWLPWRALDHLSVQPQEVQRRAAGF